MSFEDKVFKKAKRDGKPAKITTVEVEGRDNDGDDAEHIISIIKREFYDLYPDVRTFIYDNEYIELLHIRGTYEEYENAFQFSNYIHGIAKAYPFADIISFSCDAFDWIHKRE